MIPLGISFCMDNVKEIATGFYFVTLRLCQYGKMDNTRDFIVNEQQLAFLHLLTHCMDAAIDVAGQAAKE